MNDHGLEQLVNFPNPEENTLGLILASLPGQFQEVHSPDKLSDHDIVAGTLKLFIPPRKKPQREVYLYQKGTSTLGGEILQTLQRINISMVILVLILVQENFNLITSFIQEAVDKYIPLRQVDQ